MKGLSNGKDLPEEVVSLLLSIFRGSATEGKG